MVHTVHWHSIVVDCLIRHKCKMQADRTPDRSLTTLLHSAITAHVLSEYNTHVTKWAVTNHIWISSIFYRDNLHRIRIHNFYSYWFLSFVEHKSRCFVECFPYYKHIQGSKICLSICHPSRPIHPLNLLCRASVFLNTINDVMWLPILVHCH